MESEIKTEFTKDDVEAANRLLDEKYGWIKKLSCFARPASETAEIDRQIADENNRRRSLAKQRLEQWDYEATKQGLIFVPLQGKNMTPAEYDDYLSNAE